MPPQKPSRLRQSSLPVVPLRSALPCNSGKIQRKRLLYSFVQQPFWQVDDLKWPPRCYGHLQRKVYLYFAFVAACGPLQTHLHEKGRNGKRHLKTTEVPI